VSAVRPQRSAPADDPSLIDIADLALALGTDLERGLGADEAANRLRADGPNELRALPPVPLWRRALAQLQDPLVYLLGAAAAVALAAWWFEGRGQPGAAGWPLDAIVIVCVVVLNAVLGWLQEAKAAQAVAALAKMTTATSAVLRDGAVARVPSAELVQGDLLVLAEGDAVGADARLTQAAALKLLEAPLTGESEAVLKDAARLPGGCGAGRPAEHGLQGHGGGAGHRTRHCHGHRHADRDGRHRHAAGHHARRADAAAGRDRASGQGAGHRGSADRRRRGRHDPAHSDIEGVADVVTVLLLGVSLAVAAVPEGLPAILSVVLAMGVRRMARHHAIVKKLASVETLGSASVIASDKTGTLTRGEMTVQRVMTASGRSDITGVGYAPEGRAEQAGAELPEGPLRMELQAVLRGGSLAGNAQLQQDDTGTWGIQGDPTEAAFLVAERKLAGREGEPAPAWKERFERIGEIPFTSQRKMMSVLVSDHADATRTCSSPRARPTCCWRIAPTPAGAGHGGARCRLHAQVLADVAAMTGDALRTLAVARRTLASDAQIPTDAALAAALEQDLEYLGTVGIIDPPREEAAVAIAQARQAGIRVIMITGDHPRTARASRPISASSMPVRRCSRASSSTSWTTAAFTAAALQTSVFARVAPRHKLRIVRALQGSGLVVAMTGDGVNDAPALKAADIGVAMGVAGTEVTKEAARMILADDHFATIVLAVREGRGVLDNIRKFLRYLLSSNLAEVLTVFAGVVGAGVIGLKATATGSGARWCCRCWPRRSCGSTWSPTPGPRWPWAWTRSPTTSWRASRACAASASSTPAWGWAWPKPAS
jgi:Ca2+-transporting ATPase